MSNLINFNFENQTVRVELKDGEPLFCLTDIATILDINNANPSRFNLSDDGVHKMYSVDSKGRKNEITFINEPNLYRVIFRSNKKEAVKFQNWVFDEVLPSIRKTGSYSLPTPQTLSTVKDRNGLVKTCEWFVRVASYLGYDEVWNLVHHRFNINRACELTTEQVGQATTTDAQG